MGIAAAAGLVLASACGDGTDFSGPASAAGAVLGTSDAVGAAGSAWVAGAPDAVGVAEAAGGLPVFGSIHPLAGDRMAPGCATDDAAAVCCPAASYASLAAFSASDS